MNTSSLNLPLLKAKKAGNYTRLTSILNLLVEMLEPYEDRVFEHCCGSGGMFVQSEKFVTSVAVDTVLKQAVFIANNILCFVTLLSKKILIMKEEGIKQEKQIMTHYKERLYGL